MVISSFKKIIKLIIKWVLFLVPKKKGLVLFSAWQGQKYIDNTKYVYEYLLNYPSRFLIPVWYTRNKGVYSLLRSKKYPVVYSNSFKGFWLQIRAQFLLSTIQFDDYRSWLLCNCYYIDLGHGHVIKDPGEITRNKELQEEQKLFLKYIEYYTIVSSVFAKDHCFAVPVMKKENILIYNFARNDLFFDDRLRVSLNSCIEDIKHGKKAIVYMPTHRSSGKQEMDMRQILDLDSIESICERNNAVFLIKKHFYHRLEPDITTDYSCIYDISNYDLDPQMLLYQADVLISDYSACYVDYLLLDRPIVLYHYDYSYFESNERSFYIPFSTIKAAKIIRSKGGLNEYLDLLCRTWQDDLHSDRISLRQFYFSIQPQNNGRKSAVDLMLRLGHFTE